MVGASPRELMMLVALLLSGSVFAQDLVVEVGGIVALPTSGAWVRALPGDDGWDLGIATQRGYGLIPMSSTGDGPSDWTVAEADRWWLVEHDDPQLDDHNLERCPDGTWLHVATGTTSRQDDSAWWFRHAADWTLLASGEVEVGSGTMHHSDPPVMCSTLGQGVLVGPHTGFTGDAIFFEVGSTGTATQGARLSDRPAPVGGAVFADDAAGQIHRMATDGPSGPILHMTYDSDWNELSVDSANPLPSPYEAYWPQGHVRVGDYWVIATLGTPEGGGGGGGNRTRPFVIVYDLDWSVVQVVALGGDGSIEGAARPWISRKDDLLIVTFDVGLKAYLVGMQVDLDVAGDDPVIPSGGEDGDGGGSGSSDDADDEGKDSGGCAVAPVGGGLLWMAGLGLVGRRRRD